MRVRLRAAANGVVVGSKGGRGRDVFPPPSPFGTPLPLSYAPGRVGHRMIDASSPTEGGFASLAASLASAIGVGTSPSASSSCGSRFARRACFARALSEILMWAATYRVSRGRFASRHSARCTRSFTGIVILGEFGSPLCMRRAFVTMACEQSIRGILEHVE